MKTLIIAEKPSVAADLARVLGKIPKKDDYYENEQYVVSSALGHLVELLLHQRAEHLAVFLVLHERAPLILRQLADQRRRPICRAPETEYGDERQR